MNRRIVFIIECLWLFLSMPHHLTAASHSLKTPDLEVVYEDRSQTMAEEVVAMYPVVREELKQTLSWETDFKPRIILVRDRKVFTQAAGGEIFLAYAVPRRYLIVLDASRVYSKPFTLGTTLKHELCHLLLHHSIADTSLPRWLDEGVCQWASGGISELLAMDGSNALAKAIIGDRVMRMKDLETFPQDEASVVLAYEQSKNLIEYIAGRYGRDSIVRLLTYARKGYTVDESVQKSLSVSFPELEHEWHAQLKRKYSWVSYLSSNLYTILFLLGGMITIYGFIRFLKKKREYADDEEGDGL